MGQRSGHAAASARGKPTEAAAAASPEDAALPGVAGAGEGAGVRLGAGKWTRGSEREDHNGPAGRTGAGRPSAVHDARKTKRQGSSTGDKRAARHPSLLHARATFAQPNTSMMA